MDAMQFVIHLNCTINVQIHPVQNVNNGGPCRLKTVSKALVICISLFLPVIGIEAGTHYA